MAWDEEGRAMKGAGEEAGDGGAWFGYIPAIKSEQLGIYSVFSHSFGLLGCCSLLLGIFFPQVL